jgi:hypothetical protein
MARDDRGVQFKIPPSAFADLAALAENADNLSKIKDNLAAIGPGSSVKDLARRLSPLTGIGTEDLHSILNGLVNLNSLVSQVKEGPDKLVDLLTDTLERQATKSWKEESLARWKAASDQISSAIGWASRDETLLAQEKIRKLTYAHQNLLTSAKLVDDLRPIYNNDGTKIVHVILTYSLLIEYNDGEPRRIELALDAADVADLKRACERAQRKTIAAKELVKPLSLGFTVPRDVNEDSEEVGTSSSGERT